MGLAIHYCFFNTIPRLQFIYYRHGGSINKWKKEEKETILKLCREELFMYQTTYDQINEDHNNDLIILQWFKRGF